MGDKRNLSKARMELEELYLGIPDDSVNLTFQDLADVKQNGTTQNTLEKKKSNINMEPIQESKTPRQGNSPLASPIRDQPRTPRRHSSPKKLPSLDFRRGLQAINHSDHHGYDHHRIDHHVHHDMDNMRHGPSHGHINSQHHHTCGDHNGHHHHQVHQGHGGMSMAYDHGDNMSVMSMNSTYQDRGGSRARRPGVPHSNICTICSTYIYIFRHRCLVCGRVYCRNCVSIGMGEMTEGRKCVQCLGKRFSQRYIQRAGETGCCFFSRYPSSVKHAEIKWAEKGPRIRSSEMRGYNSTFMSRSRTPPRTPNLPHNASNPPSFVSASPYSPYTPTHHHLPL